MGKYSLKIKSLFSFKYFLITVFIIIVYIIAGKLGLQLAFVNASATAIWPPTGIALAAILLFGYRMAPAILIGAFLVNITTAGNIFTSCGIAFGNTLEALVGAYLVNRYANGWNAFQRVQDVFRFALFAGLISTMVSATIGVLSVSLGGFADWKSFISIWTTWWLGDSGGSLIVAPFVLLLSQRIKISFRLREILDIIFYLLAVIFATELVFSGIAPYPYLVFPVLVWGAFSFGQREAATAIILLAIVSVWNTLHGFGPYAQSPENINTALLLVQLYIGTASVTAMTLTAALFERRQTKLQLLGTEQRFKALIEKSFDAVVLIDPTSKIIYASPNVKNVLGYLPEELIGMTGFDLISPEDKKRIASILAKLVLKPGETITAEYKTIRKDKKIILVEATGTNLLFDQNVHAIVVNFRDVTEKKQQEELIRDEDKRFRALIEKGIEGIALISKEGKVIYTTSTVTELLGYTQEEYEKKAQTIVHPDDLKMAQAKSVDFLKKPGSTISLEYRILHKDGKYRWFDILATNLLEDTYVKAIVIRFRDISEQKLIEEAEKRAKAEDEAILASIGEGLIATDAQGKIVLVNNACLTLLKCKQEDLVGKYLTSVVSMENEEGEKIPVIQRPMSRVLSMLKPIVTAPTSYYVRFDKSRFPVMFTLTPIVLNGKLVGTVEVFRDITQETEIDKAKTEFVSLASHQLRTPLTTINWYSERLIGKKVGELTIQQKKYLEEIYSAGQRMGRLINALLNVSRLELGTFAVEPENVNIPALSNQIVKDFKFQVAEKKLIIKEEYSPNFPTIFADPKLLEIIIQNLFSNAVKYTPVGGTITIAISYDKAYAKIVVSDTGYGIPQRQQEKIFTKLFRADNILTVDTTGTGLGLYLVKLLLDKTGGTVRFTSAEKSGTTFTVMLPISGMHPKKGTKYLEND